MKLPELDTKLTDRVIKRKPLKPEKGKKPGDGAVKPDKDGAGDHSEVDKAREEEVARLESMGKIKEHERNLHPLKSELVRNTLLNLPTKDYVAGLKTMVRLELILTLILVIAVVGFGVFILRNPGSFVIGGGTQSGDNGSTDANISGTPTPSTADGVYDPFKGRTVKDARGNTIDDETTDGGTSAVDKVTYTNNDLKFSIEVPVSWKIEEPIVNGIKNTKISDPANTKVLTYISFQSTLPDCSAFKGEGTENHRDIYGYDTLFSATGYVKFGNALCAAFVVTPGVFYVQYAGSVTDVIIPMFETFKTF